MKAEKTGERDIKFTFDAPGNRELPQIVGQLTILPKHWWEGTDSEGRKRDISATTLEKPLGSGPYRIKEFVAGRTVTLERVKEYWGRDLGFAVGRNNFDELRYEYFRDGSVALEAFKGDQVDWRTENSAKNWATAYDFPAVNDKRVLLEEFPNRSSGIMQAFALNIRRDQFRDPRVRRALNFAFDFEEMNKQIFFGQYKRISSYFDGTELASSGLPEGKELEILETVRAEVPPEVFTKPYTNPVGGNPEAVRENLREALRLMKEAGYEVRERKLVDSKTGAPFTLELLDADPSFERVMLFFKPSLERLGITVSVRTIDPTQYENRLRSWDFDIIVVVVAAIVVAGQRAARILGLAGGRHGGLAQHHRHQESGDRQADRARHLRQGPRRPGGGDQGARPRAAVEPLRRAAVELPQGPHRALGSFWPAVRIAEIRPVGFPGAVVVRRRQGGAERKTVLKDILRMAQFSRRHVLGLGVGALAAARLAPALADNGGKKLHGLSAFGELKYPADFPESRLRQSGRAEGRDVFATRRLRRLDLQFAQRLYRQGRQGERDGASLSPR